MTHQRFGTAPDGRPVDRFHLTGGGLSAGILSYGGIVTELWVPDRTGAPGDVVLGYDTLEPYTTLKNPYFGAIVGRYANRIRRGQFTLDGTPYQLATNNGPNHLHGGDLGYSRRVWEAEPIGTSSLVLKLRDPAGAEHYPGNVEVTVTYTLTDDAALRIEYEATADAPTPINLTHHGYFNLKDAGRSDILGHELSIRALHYLPTDATLIPTGELRPVKGTPFDFFDAKTIGSQIHGVSPTKGYDHNFVLEHADGTVREQAMLYDPTSGRRMTTLTSEPGLQIFSSGIFDGTIVGKNQSRYAIYAGLCLEAQEFPDAPNRPEFPQALLRPGETYRQRTEYWFDTDRKTR